MPFAPTILEEWADRYISNWKQIRSKAIEASRYMMLTCPSTDMARTHLKAAIHQGNKTMRPQIVNQKDNTGLYNLLKYFESMTGMGGFLNTSLNMHGYPLASTLEQGVFTLEKSGLKYLAVENYLLVKKG